MKATYVEVGEEAREIFKNPVTDNGTKKSAKGLLAVYHDQNNRFVLKQNAKKTDVTSCAFRKVFSDGKLHNEQTYEEIRDRVRASV